MEYQDHLVNLLKHKLETIDTEHSIFHRVLDAVVKKVTDDVKAVIKIGEISYGKYKELSSSMEQVLNLLIQLSIEIQKPRDGVNSVNTDDIVEAVYSRLSSELTKKDKEINSMLSNQRKEIEENIQRTSDEWYQKYKELTTHLDNLEVEAQNNYKELSLEKSNSFEKHNNIMVQLKRENESMKHDILNVSERLQTLQDDWSSQNLNLSEILIKTNKDTLNKNEEFNSRLSEIVSKVGSNERYMKEQFQYLGEKYTRLCEFKNKNDQLKMHLSELSDKYDEGMRKCQVDKSETLKKLENEISTEVQETDPQRETVQIELASEKVEQKKSKLDCNIQQVECASFPNSKYTKQPLTENLHQLSDDVIELHKSIRPWVPSRKQVTTGIVANLVKERRMLKSKILFIMNRLTPTNFERLAVEMRSLNITTYEDLQELVNTFFEKAILDTKYIEAYALLCKIMAINNWVPRKEQEGPKKIDEVHKDFQQELFLLSLN